jgi:hypothetical protein
VLLLARVTTAQQRPADQLIAANFSNDQVTGSGTTEKLSRTGYNKAQE